MNKDEFSLNDKGLDVIVQVIKKDGTAENVSASTAQNIIFRKPDDSTISKTAGFLTDGVDGRIKYTLESTLLTVEGPWTVRGHIIEGSTKDYKTVEGGFRVVR